MGIYAQAVSTFQGPALDELTTGDPIMVAEVTRHIWSTLLIYFYCKKFLTVKLFSSRQPCMDRRTVLFLESGKMKQR